MKKIDSSFILMLVILPSLATFSFSACTNLTFKIVEGSGRVVTEGRAVIGFVGVTLATLGDLTIELGDKEALRIEAEDNLLPYLESNVRNQDGMLTIQTRRNTNLKPTQPIHFTLTVKNLISLSTTSLGNITTPQLQAGRFTVKISSAGNVKLAGLNADTLVVEISSLGSLTIDGGQVGSQQVTINSSGNYQAGELRSQSAEVKINSLGQATIWVTDKLDARLSSAGNLNYYGSPRVTVDASSLGKAVSLGNK